MTVTTPGRSAPTGRSGTVPGSRRCPATAARPVRRVRHEVRDGVAVVAFSAAASTVLALVLLVLVQLVG
ncbi:MAG: hypothetical protein WB441_00490 [Nocardioidaceae bacterium]